MAYLSQKNNSKLTIVLNVNCKIINFIEDNIGENLCDFKFGHEFLVQHQKPDPWRELFDVRIY